MAKIQLLPNHLRTWGEVGTVKTKTATTPKLAEKGVQCMFVGYAHNHAGDWYRMYNPRLQESMSPGTSFGCTECTTPSNRAMMI